MFGIGLPELILIMIVALLVVGPKKLPELARSLGKALHQVKSMTDDVKQTFEEDFAKDDNPGQDASEASGEDEPHATEAEADVGPDEGHIPGEEKAAEDQTAAESEAKSGPVENPPDSYSNLRG
jgi:sec-independent protein translocase protein TatA